MVTYTPSPCPLLLKLCTYLSQNIFRKVQAAGLQEQYSSDRPFAQSLLMIAGLAFVPDNRVIDASLKILETELPDAL